ncbi:MAG TPA: dihydroorotase [Thermomicrobiales bacterium]|nr:dihydroorotase [Thermomicrobiales bacterium]
MTRRTLLRGGRVIDPANGWDGVADVVIEDGTVAEVADHTKPRERDEVIDAGGKLVTPAWIDMHVHLRDPGFTGKETLATGGQAAVAGGFGVGGCMPNTSPALDSPEIIRDVIERAERDGACRVLPIASITKGRTGAEPVEFRALVEAGAIGFSDDGDTTANSAIMRQALEVSVELGVPVIVHCEDKALATGAMHEGEVSRRLGIEGIPAAAEEIIIARDVMLAELTGGWLHVCHVSTKRGIELITEAKRRGVRITAEVMPHHIVMSDEWVAGTRELHNTTALAGEPLEPTHGYTKVNPPLRPVADTVGLLEAVQRGEFDIFATDHAPHADPEKLDVPYERAAFGMSGLEFAFPATWELVRAGHVDAIDLVRLWTAAPAEIFGLDRGTLTAGVPADVTLWDPDQAWVVSRDTIWSKSANTPLIGMTLRGRAVRTWINGEEAYRA